MRRVKPAAIILLIGSLAAGEDLPPNHPPIGGAPVPAPPLNPGQGAGATDLPPGHPATGDVDPHALLRQLDAKQDEIRKKPKTFDIAFALGNLYYENARYAEAAEFFAQAIEKTRPAFRIVDQVKPKTAGGSPTDSACEGTSVEQRIERAEQLEKSQPAQALACALSAQKPALEAMSRRGTCFFLAGQIDPAIKEFESVLARDPDSVEANYRLGAIFFDAFGEDVAKLKRTRKLWDHFLQLAPEDRRAVLVRGRLKQVEDGITKGGVSKAAPLPPELLEAPPMASVPVDTRPTPATNAPMSSQQNASVPAITPEMAEAVANTPRGPEFEQGLARALDEGEAHLAKAEYQEAVQSFRSVLPYQPNNPRARAGMAAALIGKGSPMADRIFGAAIEQDPASIDSLAQKLKAGGNAKEAKELWTRLQAQAPEYAAKAGVQQKLE
jgi:tetratricopeptide (TPR) repeat protein